MPKNSEILDELDSQLLEEIRKLAACNMAPSDIALKLGINKSGFLRVWRDENSLIREQYEAGRLDIKQSQMDALNDQVDEGNNTAIQIQARLIEEADFEAKKKEIFGLE